MAYDAFLKIEGVDGESSDANHEGEIEVLGWSWGAHQTGTMHHGTGGGAGKAEFQDITITKYVDKATPILLQYCSAGNHFDDAVLTVRKAGGDEPITSVKFTMEEVLVSNIDTGGTGSEDRLTETVTFNFGRFMLEYTPQKEDGTPDAAVEAGWNIRTNEAM